MTILGGFTFLAGWFFIYLSLRNFSPTVMITLVAVMLVGLIVYLYQQAKNKREGVNVNEIYSQIPPE
jgi:hypothetical protein